MTPEQLKQIAEALDEPCDVYGETVFLVNHFDATGARQVWHPPTNNDQLVVAIEWLLERGWNIKRGVSGYMVEKGISYKAVIYRADTLAEAVCQAILQEIDNETIQN